MVCYLPTALVPGDWNVYIEDCQDGLLSTDSPSPRVNIEGWQDRLLSTDGPSPKVYI